MGRTCEMWISCSRLRRTVGLESDRVLRDAVPARNGGSGFRSTAVLSGSPRGGIKTPFGISTACPWGSSRNRLRASTLPVERVGFHASEGYLITTQVVASSRSHCFE